MTIKPNSPAAPIATGTSKAATSGPSASPAHGTGDAPQAPRTNPRRSPNTDVVAPSVGNFDGSEKTPLVAADTDHGKGE